MAAENTTHYSISALDIEGFAQRDDPARIPLPGAGAAHSAGFRRIIENTTRGTI